MNTDVKPNLLKPRWSKVFSDLWDDKTRTGLVVASIAVGVFALGVIISAYVILSEDINRSYASVNPPNIEVWTDPFDEDLVRVLEKVPGVEDVEGRSVMDIRAREGDGNWKKLSLVGVADFAGKINQLTPIEGSAVPGINEVIISQNLMDVTGFQPGETIEVELPDGSTHALNVVGLVTDQTTSRPDPNTTNNAYITSETLRSFGQEGLFNQLYVTVEGDGSDPEMISSVAAGIQEKVEEEPARSLPDGGKSFQRTSHDGLGFGDHWRAWGSGHFDHHPERLAHY